MDYVTIFDLLKEFQPEELARLTGDPSGANINQERISFAIKNATELIDSYLRERYAVPFHNIPPLVNLIARELTVYNLYEYNNRDGLIPPNITNRRYFAINLLKQLQKGSILLEDTEQMKTNRIISNKKYNKRIFDDEFLEKFNEF